MRDDNFWALMMVLGIVILCGLFGLGMLHLERNSVVTTDKHGCIIVQTYDGFDNLVGTQRTCR